MITGRILAVVLVSCCWVVSPGYSQPADSVAQRQSVGSPSILGVSFDNVVIGGGLVVYQGELDRNPYGDLSGYFLNGGMDITLGIERSFDVSFLQTNFRYMYIKGGDQYVEGHSDCCGFSNTAFGADLLSGFIVPVGDRPDMLRIFSGIGVMRHLPINSNPDLLVTRREVETLDENDGLWSLSLPIGVTVLRTVNLTGRLVLSDYVDGAASGRPYDFLFHVTISRPFALSR